jgi:large subunit ribosomal protein L3
MVPEDSIMLSSLLGKKLGMMQIFSEDGDIIPVTVVQAGPCPVVQKKTPEKDGYRALQLGFDEKKAKKVNKPMKGHFDKAGVAPSSFLREIPVDDPDQYEEGQVIRAEEVFSPGDYIDVTGVSKGKGFAGVMKRHGFSGHPAGHGTHESFRGPGSIGAAAYPARVFKGKKLPGRLGGKRVTIQNLRVVHVLGEQNLMLIKGAVPGARGGLLMIKKSVKNLQVEQESGKE